MANATNPDWFARITAVCAAFIALITLYLNIRKELFPIRRVSVRIMNHEHEREELLAVEAHNNGSNPISITNWGYELLYHKGEPVGLEVPVRGPMAPSDWPKELKSGEHVILSAPKEDILYQAKHRSPESLKKVKIRGFIVIGGRKQKFSRNGIEVILE